MAVLYVMSRFHIPCSLAPHMAGSIRETESSSIPPRATTVLIRNLALALDNALIVVALASFFVARTRVRVRVRVGVEVVLALVVVLVAAVPLDLVEAVLAGAADGIGELNELEDVLLWDC